MGDIIRIQDKRYVLRIDGTEVAWFTNHEKEDAIDTFIAACSTQSGDLTLWDVDNNIMLGNFTQVVGR